MKFSIITCTLNSAAYLRECLDSVAAQRGVRIEQVFVDGGSTDGTLEMLQAVPGETRLLTGVDGGISRAMNAGVAAATGDVIAHLHSDDFYVGPEVLATVAAGFARQPDRQWLYGRCMTVRDGVLLENDFRTKRFSWRHLIRGNIVPHPATFIRRAAFEAAGGFDEALKYTMDYDLWLRLAALGPPIQIADYLAAFREHPGSLSSANVWACHDECLRVRLRHAPRHPLSWAEHRLRHAWRSHKMRREAGVASAS